MINGEGVPSDKARTVRLKTPAHWRHQNGAGAPLSPPRYQPHPDTLQGLLRCLWCLTRLDPDVPVKYRQCPCCGHLGQSSEPLYGKHLFVEYY